jgi:hypothetical protein
MHLCTTAFLSKSRMNNAVTVPQKQLPKIMLKFRGYANELPFIFLVIVREFANSCLGDIIARLCAGSTRCMLLLTHAQGVDDDHSRRDKKWSICDASD